MDSEGKALADYCWVHDGIAKRSTERRQCAPACAMSRGNQLEVELLLRFDRSRDQRLFGPSGGICPQPRLQERPVRGAGLLEDVDDAAMHLRRDSWENSDSACRKRSKGVRGII